MRPFASTCFFDCVPRTYTIFLATLIEIVDLYDSRSLTNFTSALQANQKLWDWRSSLRHAAEVVVGHYLDQSPHTLDVENRGVFCEKIIEGARFLYQNPLGQKTTVRHSVLFAVPN